jgi:mannose-6-phosphate isomerase-like protein (cupin superfamily)
MSKTLHTRYAELPAYATKDGSEIREMMHPGQHGNAAQSLAEARIAPGATTRLHRHRASEEIYHVTAGHGQMTLGGQRLDIGPGDTIAIPPGTPHDLVNTGGTELIILCCCSPPYSHDDTELL